MSFGLLFWAAEFFSNEYSHTLCQSAAKALGVWPIKAYSLNFMNFGPASRGSSVRLHCILVFN